MYALGNILWITYLKSREYPNTANTMTHFETLTSARPKKKPFCRRPFLYDDELKFKVHARAIHATIIGCKENGVRTVDTLSERIIVNYVHFKLD